ncbi:TPM domain-containing protein [Dechloromonas denitrificans]|uniref:TPM domain-containing protein n=1 Tax=Dechloromonas denitrificans TaxID=281362 RepID=UPI001CF7FB14|nr:TPM domain-containing protein [Dechloromonas denitrificans]UCV04822.1 TPM domain-containing protein [Dechloromonas denitrificans]
MRRLLALLALCLPALLAVAAAEAVPIPALTARVTDLTASLSAAQAGELEARLAAFEAKKGSQVVVLVLPTTQPEPIEQFGIRLLDAWKIGRKGIDDGAILIVAKDDRRLRIEVGYGLEGVLNDATAKRIIDETITPKFKAGDLPGGIAAGVDAILAAVDREELPAATARANSAASGGGRLNIDSFGENTWLIGLGIIAVGGAIIRYFLGNLLGSGVVGGVTAGLGWLLTGSILGALAGAAIGFFVALLGLDLLLSGLASGGRGGSSGGGGFGGGGGSGGGGGASGSW